MKKNKAILSIILILLVAAIGIASVFISNRLSNNQAVAPNAPASIPQACVDKCPDTDGVLRSCTPSADGSFQSLCNSAGRVEVCGGKSYTCPAPGGTWALTPSTESAEWVGSTACTITATSTCVASGVVTCSIDCPTTCGNPASTITTCTDSCGIAATKACAATTACAEDLVITKKAFKDNGSTASNYSYSTEIDTVSKNQTFIYAVTVTNNGKVDITGATITDILNGDHQDQLTFVDANRGCTYSATDKKVTCAGISVKAGGETISYAFRVKVSDSAVNGDTIKNLASFVAGNISINATNEVTVSTLVSCNHTCTTDSECGSGLICDTAINKCRKSACTAEETCSCPVVTTVTQAPMRTVVVTEAPITLAPTERVAEVTVQPTVLPETGILDFPGVAAFGGGLMLAIVGILLAL